MERLITKKVVAFVFFLILVFVTHAIAAERLTKAELQKIKTIILLHTKGKGKRLSPAQEEAYKAFKRYHANKTEKNLRILKAKLARLEEKRPKTLFPTPQSTLKRAIAYYCGTAGVVDEEKAKILFIEAAEKGDPLAIMWIARLRFMGKCHFTRDEQKAKEEALRVIDRVRQMAERGNPEAMFLLGSCYDFGLALPADRQKALFWYKKAALKGNDLAMVNLSFLLERVNHPDYDRIFYWLQKAASKGNAYGMLNLVGLYAEGRGVAKNERKAFYWAKKAAEKGMPEAMSMVGSFYEQGIGVTQDRQQALFWYRKAAEKGDVKGMFSLGTFILLDKSGGMNKAEAVKWLKLAAEKGYSSAYHNLGYCYYNGVGVPKDIEMAKYWYQKAAEEGDEEAKKILQEISGVSSQPQTISPGGSGVGAASCFIATAAYGTPWEKHVLTLRKFREKWLLTNWLGRKIVEMYYTYSPPLANYIKQKPVARLIVRGMLTPVVIVAGACLGDPADICMLFAAILLLCYAGYRVHRKKKTNNRFIFLLTFLLLVIVLMAGVSVSKAEECNIDAIMKRCSSEIRQVENENDLRRIMVNTIIGGFYEAENKYQLLTLFKQFYSSTFVVPEGDFGTVVSGHLRQIDGLLKEMGYLVAAANVLQNGYEALFYGNKTAAVKAIVTELKVLRAIAVQSLSSLPLDVAMAGMTFMRYALENFMESALKEHEEYWWNVYLQYMEHEYPNIVKGPDSWVNLIIKEGPGGVQRRLYKFWEDPLYWAGIYGQGKYMVISRDALADGYKKRFAGVYYKQFLHPTISTYFRRKMQHAIKNAKLKARQTCTDLKMSINDFLKKYVIVANKVYMRTNMDYVYRDTKDPDKICIYTDKCNFLAPEKGGLKTVKAVCKYIEEELGEVVDMRDKEFRSRLYSYCKNLPEGGLQSLERNADKTIDQIIHWYDMHRQFMSEPRILRYLNSKVNLKEIEKLKKERIRFKKEIVAYHLAHAGPGKAKHWLEQLRDKINTIQLVEIRGPIWCVAPREAESIVTFPGSKDKKSVNVIFKPTITLRSSYYIVAGPIIEGDSYKFVVNTGGKAEPVSIKIDISVNENRTSWGNVSDDHRVKKEEYDYARDNCRVEEVKKEQIEKALMEHNRLCWVACDEALAKKIKRKLLAKKEKEVSDEELLKEIESSLAKMDEDQVIGDLKSELEKTREIISGIPNDDGYYCKKLRKDLNYHLRTRNVSLARVLVKKARSHHCDLPFKRLNQILNYISNCQEMEKEVRKSLAREDTESARKALRLAASNGCDMDASFYEREISRIEDLAEVDEELLASVEAELKEVESLEMSKAGRNEAICDKIKERLNYYLRAKDVDNARVALEDARINECHVPYTKIEMAINLIQNCRNIEEEIRESLARQDIKTAQEGLFYAEQNGCDMNFQYYRNQIARLQGHVQYCDNLLTYFNEAAKARDVASMNRIINLGKANGCYLPYDKMEEIAALTERNIRTEAENQQMSEMMNAFMNAMGQMMDQMNSEEPQENEPQVSGGINLDDLFKNRPRTYQPAPRVNPFSSYPGTAGTQSRTGSRSYTRKSATASGKGTSRTTAPRSTENRDTRSNGAITIGGVKAKKTKVKTYRRKRDMLDVLMGK